MGHTRTQYENAIRGRLGDLGLLQHIDETQIPIALEDALLTFSKDRPRRVSGTFSGDGTTQTFDLSTLTGWATGWSRVASVEYPAGEIPPRILDSHRYTVDEESDDLVIYFAPDAGADNIKIRFFATYPFPNDTADTDLVADVYYPAITAKAGANTLRAKANEFARQQSTSVAGDLFRRDAEPLFRGASLLEKVYTDTVLGRPTGEGDSKQVALAVGDVDTFPDSLFHRRSDYIAREGRGS